jgi:FMN reductase
MNGKIVGLSGSISRPSRTRVLVDAAVSRAARRYGREAAVIELSSIAPSIGAASKLADLDHDARSAITLLVEADALVLASPVYKGSYGGLFKHLLDLLDPLSLAGKPVLLGATGGGSRHALVIEHQLRPLLGFFEAQTLATGVYASDADIRDGALVSEALNERLDRAVGQFAPFLAPRPATDFAGDLLAVAR